LVLVAEAAVLVLVKFTGLIAVVPAEISTLLTASGSVLFEVAGKTLPVVAVIEAVVKARCNLVTAAEWPPVPVSGNPSIASVVLRPIAVNPVVVRARAWRDIGCVRRSRLVEPGAVSSEAYADCDSVWANIEPPAKSIIASNFVLIKCPSFLPSVSALQWLKVKCNGMRRILGFAVLFGWCRRTRLVFLGRRKITEC
jgi:hypothetical protein